ncbi:MAG: hypothetical protein ACKOCN_08785 [Planctomycetaceae bacterium]
MNRIAMQWLDSQFGMVVVAIAGLVALVSITLVVIAWIRREMRRPGEGRADWEETLATYKNLQRKGVLDEDEYRKIRTILDPNVSSAGRGDSTGHSSRSEKATDG